jgi:hypothetical protein
MPIQALSELAAESRLPKIEKIFFRFFFNLTSWLNEHAEQPRPFLRSNNPQTALVATLDTYY